MIMNHSRGVIIIQIRNVGGKTQWAVENNNSIKKTCSIMSRIQFSLI